MVATVDRVPAALPVSRRRRWGGLVALAVGVVALGLAVPFYQRGIAAGIFPTWIPGTPDYVIDRYSGPWIMGSFGLILLALCAFPLAYSRLRRPPAIPPAAYPSYTWPLLQVPTAAPAPLVAAEPRPGAPAETPSPWARPE